MTTTATSLAFAYTALASLPIAMHLALAAGAPLGRFTVGGRFRGALPPLWRGLAVAQGALLALMATVILVHGGAIAWLGALPGWSIWPVIAVTALSLVANIASPSKPERWLWSPVLALMLAAALGVATA